MARAAEHNPADNQPAATFSCCLKELMNVNEQVGRAAGFRASMETLITSH